MLNASVDVDSSPASLPPAVARVSQLVVDGIKRTYSEKIRPVEMMYGFEAFRDVATDSEFEAKPSVLLIGQYSVGKTTFIRQLLGRDFPGCRIGPEPTTDKFVAVSHSTQEKVVPGNALVVNADSPYRAFSKFGVDFLNKFEGSFCDSKFLESVTLIDTPGILAGEKQVAGRGYNYNEVVAKFAEQCDLILLLFDANKTDIGDEMRNAMQALKGNEDKVRVVLNKSDVCDKQQLMRVYGALMWSLGKVLDTPEVTRVYIGSFREDAYNKRGRENADLFDSERADLLADLRMLPRSSVIRKINDLVKRARLVKVHAHIIAHLRAQMPAMFGGDTKKEELLETMGDVFKQVSKDHALTWGDFPSPAEYTAKLKRDDFYKFAPLHPKLIGAMEQVLHTDIPKLMRMLPDEAAYAYAAAEVGHSFAADGLPELGVGEGWQACEESQATSGRWQLDEAVTYCPLCAKDFGLMLRRHHCRTCGGVFCDDCTTLTKQSNRDSRMCNGCRAASFVN